MDELARTPGGPAHWADLRPRGILKTDATVAAKKETMNRQILDRQRNEIALKILVLGAPRSGKSSFIRALCCAAIEPEPVTPTQPLGATAAGNGSSTTEPPPPPTLGIETTTMLAVAMGSTPVFWRLVEVSDALLRAASPAQLDIVFSGVHGAFVLFDATEASARDTPSLAAADACRDELQRRFIALYNRSPPLSSGNRGCGNVGAVATPAAGELTGGHSQQPELQQRRFPCYLVAYKADGIVGAAVASQAAGLLLAEDAAAAAAAAAVAPLRSRGRGTTAAAATAIVTADAFAVARAQDGSQWRRQASQLHLSAQQGPSVATAAATAGMPSTKPKQPGLSKGGTGSALQRPPPPGTTGGNAFTSGPTTSAAALLSALALAAAPASAATNPSGLLTEYCYGLSEGDVAAFADLAGYRGAFFLCSPWLDAPYTGVASGRTSGLPAAAGQRAAGGGAGAGAGGRDRRRRGSASAGDAAALAAGDSLAAAGGTSSARRPAAPPATTAATTGGTVYNRVSARAAAAGGGGAVGVRGNRPGGGAAAASGVSRGRAGGTGSECLTVAPPAAISSTRHRLTSLAAAARLREAVFSVSADALSYWGYSIPPPPAAVAGGASTEQAAAGEDAALATAVGSVPAPPRLYEWECPWPLAADPVGLQQRSL